MVAEDMESIEDEPQILNKVWNHPNMTRGHLEGVQQCEETTGMEKMLKSCMPPNCRCVKNKWVIKIK